MSRIDIQQNKEKKGDYVYAIENNSSIITLEFPDYSNISGEVSYDSEPSILKKTVRGVLYKHKNAKFYKSSRGESKIKKAEYYLVIEADLSKHQFSEIIVNGKKFNVLFDEKLDNGITRIKLING